MSPLVPAPAAADLLAVDGPQTADARGPGSVWRAPLVPLALAVTAGILLDRSLSVPLAFSLLTAAVALLAWLCARAGTQVGLPPLFLALAAAACAAAYHHYCRDVYPPDDIGAFAPDEPYPVQVRGLLEDEPLHTPAAPRDPLRSLPRDASTTAVLRVTHLQRRDDWVPVSGRARLQVAGAVPGLHAGDEVEVVGRLSAIAGPANPGEFDTRAHWRDQAVRARLVVQKTAAGVTRLSRNWHHSFAGWRAVVRGWGQDVLRRTLPEQTGPLAVVLLLGEGTAFDREEWDRYIRTGVLHVLAISGQHLVILAAILWWSLRRLGVRQRHGAWVVALVLLGYALLSGGRPPALRSAVAVCALCGGLVLRRRTMPANLFALSWLVVALLNTTDLFSTGCQLSFLCVAVLYWGTRQWFTAERDPLEVALDAGRPAWLRGLRWAGQQVGTGYAVTAFVWLLITPLAAAQYHLASPAGILLGPPLALLTSVALLAGFLLLLTAGLCGPLAVPFALVVRGSLGLCQWLVDWADGLPLSHVYIAEVPAWWLWVFYLALLALLTQVPLRRRWRWGVTAGLGWLCVGLLAGAARLPSDELRCTFLAVGHGGCTVLEMPDGRTLLYDAGAMRGPDVTRRQIAPFLWSRGIRRLDEVFLSHGDLDHFNGLVELLDRFSVGQVTCTPSFADKATPGVRHILGELERRGLPTRTVRAGDRLSAGDVQLEVLHPPATGPEGDENARSLVLHVRHAGHSLLLTGDLDGAGMERVLRLPARRVDVMMAPHHGSHRVNVAGLMKWARPRLVVSCQGPPRGSADAPEAYARAGAQFLGTWPHGAITLHSHASGMVVETFVTGQRFVIRSGKNRE